MFVEKAPAASPLTDVPLELIERRIEQLAAGITASMAEWLELVGEFDRREGWADTGCRSTAEWVSWRCSVLPRAAREHIRVARALPELPQIRLAFSAGELSYSKVRALTRVAEAESEAELLELARHATAAQLERIVRAARRCSAIEADEIHGLCHVSWSWNPDDGTLEISAKLAPEDGATFIEAMAAARSALADRRQQESAEAAEERRGGSAEPPLDSPPGGSAEPPRPTNAECFAALSELALCRPPSGFNGVSGAERHQLMVHVDVETLATDSPGAGPTGRGCSHLARGPGVAAETVRRLACDSSVVPVVELDGAPVAVGRQSRSIPPATRRALISRDERCQFPGCERHRYVDAHHIRHWAQGGETTLDNLVLLCRHHHRLVHEGGFSVARDRRDRLRWRAPDGSPLSASAQPARLWPRHRRVPEGVGPLLTGTGERMDREMCVDAALTAMLGPRVPAAPAAGVPG
jgi:hypothetical protein